MKGLKEFLGLSYYTSSLDEFLKQFDESNKKLSSSQQQEIKKYKRIFALRDKPAPEVIPLSLWDKF